MRTNLILSNSYDSVPANEKILFVSKFYYDLAKENSVLKKNVSICKPIDLKKKEKISNLIECDKIYNSVLKDISIELNNFHKKNLSIYDWEILMGMWLKRFIWIFFYEYKLLKNALSEFKVDDIYLIEEKNYKLFTKETVGLHSAIYDFEWCNILFSKIIKFLEISENRKFVSSYNNNFKNQKTFFEYTNLRTSKKKYFLSFFSWLTRGFVSNEDAVIINTNFKFLTEKRLEILLRQIPQFWSFPEIKYSGYDYKRREKIKLKKENSSEPEKILREILPEAIPLCLVENFDEIEKIANKIGLPKNPKFIFTSMEHQFNEVFKRYIVKKKTNFYIGQHGQGQHSHFINNFLIDSKISSKEILWGSYSKNQHNLKGFNFKVLGKKRYFSKNGYLTIISRGFSLSSCPYDTYEDDKAHLISTGNILEKINREIKDKIFFKPHPANYNREFNLLKKLIPNKNIKFIKSQNHFDQIMKKTRLSFFNNDSTLFAENLALNNPSVLYWKNPFENLNDNACEFYQLLINANIIFTNETSLVDHINNNWQNIEKWWKSGNTQNSISTFNNMFNMVPNDESLKRLSRKLIL